VTDLPRSLAFYQNLFGLTIIQRPPFKGAGAWLACGAHQVHLIPRIDAREDLSRARWRGK
jgi:hypothetical protein